MNVIEKMLTETTPAIFVDREGFVVEVNPGFLETYEWEKSQLVGRPLTRIIPEKYHDAHNLSFSRYLLTGSATIFSQWVDLEVLTGAGKVVLARHFIVACREHHQICLAAQIVPVA